MVKNKVVSVAVGAFIKNSNNQYLIIRRSQHDSLPGMWELPSGKKEFLESVENAVIREVLEECGLNVKVLKLINYFEYRIEKENEVRDSLQLNFACEAINNPIFVVLSSDHDKYAWVDLNTVDNYNLSDSTKNSLLKYLNASSFN